MPPIGRPIHSATDVHRPMCVILVVVVVDEPQLRQDNDGYITVRFCSWFMRLCGYAALWLAMDPLHDDVKNQNKPGALCIVEFIGGPLSDNTVIIPPFQP